MHVARHRAGSARRFWLLLAICLLCCALAVLAVGWLVVLR